MPAASVNTSKLTTDNRNNLIIVVLLKLLEMCVPEVQNMIYLDPKPVTRRRIREPAFDPTLRSSLPLQ
jgi:hypothetical protein